MQGLSEKEKADIWKKKFVSSGLAPALQDLKEAEYENSQAIIKAPFSGVVANVSVRLGEMVKPGSEMFRLYIPTQMVLSAKVLESDISFMRKNDPLSIY